MTAGQASGLSSTGSRGISRYSEDEIVRDVSTALDMTELLSSVAGRLYPLPLQKGEDKGEGLFSVARGFNRTIGFHLSIPHLRPLSLEEERRLLRLAPGSNGALAGNQRSTTSHNRRECSFRGARSKEDEGEESKDGIR